MSLLKLNLQTETALVQTAIQFFDGMQKVLVSMAECVLSMLRMISLILNQSQ